MLQWTFAVDKKAGLEQLCRALTWRHENLILLLRMFGPSRISDAYEREEWSDSAFTFPPSHEQRTHRQTLIENHARHLLGLRILISGTVRTPVKVFLSHSSSDIELVDTLSRLLRLALTLSAEDIRCTSVPGLKLAVGDIAADQLRQEVTYAPAFVILVTENSLRSTYVLFELGARWASGRRMQPILACGINPSRLSGPLAAYNALSCDSAADIHQLIQDIGTSIGIRPGSPASYQRELDSLVAISASIRHAD